MVEGKVCRRCGKHYTLFFAPDQSMWWGGRDGITVGELRKALDGVPDDVEVEVGSSTLFSDWAGADSAYVTTKRVALATDDPQTVPVFRIAGGEHDHGVGWAPGTGGQP
ncbi:MAG: hypothetical protein ACTHKG_20150 [Nocardioides sp.]